MTTDTRDRIQKVLQKNFAGLDLSESIARQLSSIDLVTLVSYLEDEFKITVHAVEFDQDIFSTVEGMTNFVDEKKLKL
jgi:acyl carrier protein